MEKVKKKNKVGGYFSTVLHQIGLNPRRVVNSMIFLLVFSSLASICYILLQANGSGTSYQLFLTTSPQSAVMFIISAIDLGLGYVLWKKKEEVISNRKSFRAFNIFLLFSQLIVGNFVCVILAAISLYIATQVREEKESSLSSAEIALFIVCILMYLFCAFVLLKLR